VCAACCPVVGAHASLKQLPRPSVRQPSACERCSGLFCCWPLGSYVTGLTGDVLVCVFGRGRLPHGMVELAWRGGLCVQGAVSSLACLDGICCQRAVVLWMDEAWHCSKAVLISTAPQPSTSWCPQHPQPTCTLASSKANHHGFCYPWSRHCGLLLLAICCWTARVAAAHVYAVVPLRVSQAASQVQARQVHGAHTAGRNPQQQQQQHAVVEMVSTVLTWPSCWLAAVCCHPADCAAAGVCAFLRSRGSCSSAWQTKHSGFLGPGRLVCLMPGAALMSGCSGQLERRVGRLVRCCPALQLQQGRGGSLAARVVAAAVHMLAAVSCGLPDAAAALSCPALCAAVAVPCAGSGPRVDCPPCGDDDTVPSWLHTLFRPCLVWWWVTGTRATALLSLLVRRLQLLLRERQGASCRQAHSARCSPGCRLGVRVQLGGGATLSVPHQHPCSWDRWLVVTALL
jgi:hypothetical protein